MSIKPPRLKHGQEIGVIAPAGPVTQSEIQPGIDLLESFGYKVICSPHLYHKKGYLAGDDNSRLEDLHAMFQNGRIKAIFCARGGYGTLRLLEKINFDLIHQLNMVGFREPGYLWKLNIPFVWGPIGGMIQFPWKFLPCVGIGGSIYHICRNLINWHHMHFLTRPKKAARHSGEGLIAATSEIQNKILF